MKRTARIAIVAAGAACVMSSAPAFAADDLRGNWLFDTSTFEADCKIKGNIAFTPTKVPNTYSCVFVSEQICGPENKNLYIKVKQNCTATKVGNQVAVKSTIDHVLDRKPKIENPELSYLADNFVLTMQKNLNEMLGGHYDAVRQLKARFWRDTDLIS